jgi:Phage integrase, N-terminal SAM-like domain
LPAVIVLDQTTVVKPGGAAVPAVVAAAGEQASWRYLEFFTANIRNPHTRRAYGRACARFFAWCGRRRLGITDIRPFDIAAYIERLQGEAAAPSAKQELAATRMLFDWLVVGQVLPMNPAAAVRGPTHVVKSGKTPVLDGSEWRRLVDAIPTDTVHDRRDRALIATLTYSFAHISAALKIKVEDLRARGRLRAAAARERRQAARHSLPSCAGRRAARLHQRRRHWRGAQGLAVSHRQGLEGKHFVRPADEPGRRLAHDPPAGESRRHQGADRLPYLPRHWDYGLSGERRDARARPSDGGARKPAHH